MAKLRTARAYRRVKRPWTRVSRKKKKSFVRGAPNVRVVMFDNGNLRKQFPVQLDLISRVRLQVRDNALEAARQTAVRHLDIICGKENWFMKIRAVPHHVIREKPLATGAGADRFQQGMGHGFGKPYGHACQVKIGKILMSFYVNQEHVAAAKEAARKATCKMPMRCETLVKKNPLFKEQKVEEAEVAVAETN